MGPARRCGGSSRSSTPSRRRSAREGRLWVRRPFSSSLGATGYRSRCEPVGLYREDPAFGLRNEGTGSESGKQSPDEPVGSLRVSGSNVEGERLQWSLVGRVHLDIDAGQGDVHPLGIRGIGLRREFSHGFHDGSVSEREGPGPTVVAISSTLEMPAGMSWTTMSRLTPGTLSWDPGILSGRTHRPAIRAHADMSASLTETLTGGWTGRRYRHPMPLWGRLADDTFLQPPHGAAPDLGSV